MNEKFKFDYGTQEFEGRVKFLEYVGSFLVRDYDNWDYEVDQTERFIRYTKEWNDDDDNNIEATIEADARNKLNDVDFILYEVQEVKKNGFKEDDYDVEEALEEFEDGLDKAEEKMEGSKASKHSP